MEATLAQLAGLTGACLRGDGDRVIVGAAGIQQARGGEIAFVASGRYARFAATTGASALVVGPQFDPATTALPLLVAEDPEAAFEAIAARLSPPAASPEPGIHPTAAVAPEATVDPSATVGACCVVEPGAIVGPATVLRPLVVVGADARVGAGCVLHPHVAVLDRCILGDRVTLHSGVVIGADGFGYQFADGVHKKLPQRGIVEIGDDVEIGANTTVDRARYGRTVIARGTKIDNLVQVAHNVSIGEHCIVVAQAGIAGSTSLGHHVVLAAQTGIIGHIEIGDGAVVAAQSGVGKSIDAGATFFGSPAQPIRDERRCIVAYRRLPDLTDQVRRLTKTIDQLTRKVRQLEGCPEDHPETR